ncbi:hypothetical protein JMJ35_000050 [Cladonia borealis]|uniref:Uncharacterized protein n=1 Tax=Cladonia borealis TaxID=184061 RepID=A0AA39R8N3_9LECA|nr:hypothetical protein JMJ35_000050 [Cladonia borealis]
MLTDLQVLEYVKGRYEVGPPIHLGDNPEPEDTVYDTTGGIVGEHKGRGQYPDFEFLRRSSVRTVHFYLLLDVDSGAVPLEEGDREIRSSTGEFLSKRYRLWHDRKSSAFITIQTNSRTYPETQEDSNTAPTFKASIISQHKASALASTAALMARYTRRSIRTSRFHLGDDPEPEDTVYDTTVNPLPLSPSKPIPGHIPRHKRTQIELPRPKPASLASIREEYSKIPSRDSADFVSSSRQIEEEAMHEPSWHYQNSHGVLGPSSSVFSTIALLEQLPANPPDFYLVKSDWNPEFSSEDPLPQSCSSAEAGDLNFVMLNARRLNEFLTENVDGHATYLLV